MCSSIEQDKALKATVLVFTMVGCVVFMAIQGRIDTLRSKRPPSPCSPAPSREREKCEGRRRREACPSANGSACFLAGKQYWLSLPLTFNFLEARSNRTIVVMALASFATFLMVTFFDMGTATAGPAWLTRGRPDRRRRCSVHGQQALVEHCCGALAGADCAAMRTAPSPAWK